MAARSTHVTLKNKAGRLNLRQTAAELDHGEWTSKPPVLIGNEADWASESNGFATGTEGRVTYQIEDVDGVRVGEVRLHWDNPFIGSNSYDESVAPQAADATSTGFSVVHIGGEGNDANVEFVLLNGFCGVDSDGSTFCSHVAKVAGASDRYAAVWARMSGPSWRAVHGLSSQQYQEAFDELTGQGFRPVDVSGYSVGGEDRFAAIFEQSQGPPFAARHGLSSQQYQEAFDELTGQGFRLVGVSGYAVG